MSFMADVVVWVEKLVQGNAGVDPGASRARKASEAVRWSLLFDAGPSYCGHRQKSAHAERAVGPQSEPILVQRTADAELLAVM